MGSTDDVGGGREVPPPTLTGQMLLAARMEQAQERNWLTRKCTGRPDCPAEHHLPIRH